MSRPFTIASFDIGLKNLAFCVMQFENDKQDGEKFPILVWKNIDMTDKNNEGIEDFVCEAFLKSKPNENCKLGAKIKTKEGKYFCNRHNPDPEKYKPRKKRKVKSIALDEMCCTLANRMDAFEELFKTKVDHVVIETQFSRNRKMICLSNMLYSYFILKHVLIEDSTIKKVKFVSSRNKLKVYTGPFVECNRKNAKDKRKQLAIKYCEWMIRHDEKHLAEFNKFPRKKDDLSDCYLQGAWYMMYGSGVPTRIQKPKSKNSKSKNSKSKNSKSKNSETKKSESKNSETKKSETKNSKTKNLKTKNLKTKNSKTKNSKTKNLKTKNSKGDIQNLMKLKI